MYTLSLWASNHIWPARFAIVGSYVLLNFLGLFIGDGLQLFEIAIPMFLFYAAAGLFLAVFVIYPDKSEKSKHVHFYRFQKTCDGILAVTTFFFTVFIGNQPQKMLSLSAPPAAYASITHPVPPTAIEKPAIKPAPKFSKKALRHLLVEKVKQWRKLYKGTSKGGKIALITLSVLVALGLLLLVASLACGLSCNGSDGLAVLVGIAGLSLILFLFVRVVRRIQNGPKQKRAAPAERT